MEIRSTFHKRLLEVQNDVLEMGSMVEKAITLSIKALEQRDLTLAHQIVPDDHIINHKRFEVEEKCIQLIATQQPIANDLRLIVAVLNIITELERIGDYAVGIAKITIMLGDEPPLKPLIDIPLMAKLTVDMLKRSLEAFISHDSDAARKICDEDDAVDLLYEKIFLELSSFMMDDPKTVTRATRLIWLAHDLERCADRVTNICERVVYVETGKMEEIEH